MEINWNLVPERVVPKFAINQVVFKWDANLPCLYDVVQIYRIRIDGPGLIYYQTNIKRQGKQLWEFDLKEDELFSTWTECLTSFYEFHKNFYKETKERMEKTLEFSQKIMNEIKIELERNN